MLFLKGLFYFSVCVGGAGGLGLGESVSAGAMSSRSPQSARAGVTAVVESYEPVLVPELGLLQAQRILLTVNSSLQSCKCSSRQLRIHMIRND